MVNVSKQETSLTHTEIESKTKKEIKKEYKKGLETDVQFLLSLLFVSFTRCFGIIDPN